MFTAQGVIPENSPSSVSLLGSPLSAGHQLDMLLKEKREDLLLLMRRLQFMPAHDSLYLLRHVLTPLGWCICCGQLHVLTFQNCHSTTPFSAIRCLPHSTSSWTTNDGTKHHCHSDGVVFVYVAVVLLAPSAYLASAASTAECTSTLLLARLRDIKDSGIDAALSAWSKQATSPAGTVDVFITTRMGWHVLQLQGAGRLYSMQPSTQLAVLVFSLLVLRAPAIGWAHCYCPPLAWRWTTQVSVLPSVCVLEHHSSARTSVSVCVNCSTINNFKSKI